MLHDRLHHGADVGDGIYAQIARNTRQTSAQRRLVSEMGKRVIINHRNKLIGLPFSLLSGRRACSPEKANTRTASTGTDQVRRSARQVKAAKATQRG
jgi:hypothetical protein